MRGDIENFDAFEDYSEYSHMGRNFGSVPINAVMHNLFGRHLMPAPRNGQDMYDALIQRERSQHFMNLQSSGFANNMLNQAMGISGPAAAMVGRMGASPNSSMARMLSPLVGGNPMAASMQIYAGLSGASTMGAFGRFNSINEGESQQVMNALANNFYKKQSFGGPGGLGEELNRNTTDFLKSLVDKNDTASIRHLRDSGISVDTDRSGRIKDPNKLKQQIGKLDFTSGFRAGEAEDISKAQITAGLGRDMSRALEETDATVKAALEERIEKIFKATGATITGHVRTAPSTAEKTAARRDLAADLFKSLDELKIAPDREKGKISAQIKQQFRDLGMSEQRLQKITGSDGNIKDTDARQLAADFALGRTDFVERESQEATKARDAMAIKQIQKAKLLESVKAVRETSEGYKDSSDTSAAGIEANKKAKKEFEEKRLRSGGELQEEAQKALNIDSKEFKRRYLDKNNKLLLDKLEKDIEKSTQLSRPEEARLGADAYGASGFKRKGINFENTRGFNIEDFTSAYAKAAELRMLGDARGKTPAEMMDAFSKNAGGVMAASRSLFGNRSGGELMQKARDLMGVTAVDLSTENGAKDIEDMLRKVKSTARVAGLSVKSMLGIIEATRDLARSNPQLQYMNQGAITNLAVASTMHAATAGARMSSADFTNAGGGQGIMAAESKSSLAFAQSGMGRLMTVALGQAKARGREKEMLQLIREGKFTATELARGGYSEIAKIAGVSTGALSYMANDPEVAQRYLKDKSIADVVTGEQGDNAIASTMSRVVSRSIFGKSGQEAKLAELYKQAKAAGMTDDEFEAKYVDPNLNSAQRSAFQTHKVKFFRNLRDSSLPPEVKNVLNTIRDADMKASASTSKAMEGKTGALASQAISAILNNEGMDNIADALVGIFATGGDARSKSINEQAQKSAKELYDSIRDKGKGSAKERLDRIDVKDASGVSDLDRLNSVIDAQRDQANQVGDTERARVLKNLTKKDIIALQRSSGETTAEGAKARLAELRKRVTSGETLSPELQKQLETLEAQEKLGGFSSDAAYRAVSSRQLGGLVGGLLEGGKASAEKAGVEERKKAAFKTMDESLTKLAKNDSSIAAAQKYYSNKGGARQLAEDLQQGKGMFADKATREKYASGTLGSIVDATKSSIAAEETRLAGEGKKAPAEDSATTAFKAALEPILQAITGSDSLKVAIDKLATALGNF